MKKYHRRICILIPVPLSLPRALLLLFALLLLVAAGTAAWAWRAYERPLSMRSERIEFRIAPGATARSIARQLQTAGIEVNETVFAVAARYAKMAQSLRAGRYEVTRGASLHQLLDKLRAGETLRERITIVEGWTVRDLRAALSAHPDLKQDSAAMSESQLLRAIGASETHAEGLFAPDTYVFDAGSSDLDVLRQAYR